MSHWNEWELCRTSCFSSIFLFLVAPLIRHSTSPTLKLPLVSFSFLFFHFSPWGASSLLLCLTLCYWERKRKMGRGKKRKAPLKRVRDKSMSKDGVLHYCCCCGNHEELGGQSPFSIIIEKPLEIWWAPPPAQIANSSLPTHTNNFMWGLFLLHNAGNGLERRWVEHKAVSL